MKILHTLCAIVAGAILHSSIATADTHNPSNADAVWIDVRTAAEFATGSLPNAQLIPYDGIEAGVQKLALSKDTPIYLFCRSGGRAGLAKTRLEQQGFTHVENLGGVEDARAKAAAIAAPTT